MNELEKIHEWLRETKSINRLSYKNLGECINYTDTGFSKALENNRLSVIQVETIVKKFGLESSFSEKFGKFPIISKPDTLEDPGANYEKPRRIEDIIADKVIDKIMPQLTENNKKLKQIIAALSELVLDVDDIKDVLEEIKQKA